MDEGKGWMGERDGSNGARIEGRIVEEARFAFHQSTSLSGRLAWFHNESYTLIWRQPQIFTTVIIKSVHFNDCFPPVNHLCSVLPLWDPSLLHHSSSLCLFLSSRFSLPNRSAVVSSCGLTGEGFPPLLLPSLLSRSPLSFDLFPSSLLLPSETYKGKERRRESNGAEKRGILSAIEDEWRVSLCDVPLLLNLHSIIGNFPSAERSIRPILLSDSRDLRFNFLSQNRKWKIKFAPAQTFFLLPGGCAGAYQIMREEGMRKDGKKEKWGSIDPVRVCSLLLEWLFDAWESRCFNDLG